MPIPSRLQQYQSRAQPLEPSLYITPDPTPTGWFIQSPGPVPPARRPVNAPSTCGVLEPSLTVRFLGRTAWQQQSEPVRRTQQPVRSQWWCGVVEPVVINVPAPNGWYVQHPVPVRRQHRVNAPWFVGSLEPTLISTPTTGWWVQPSEPVRTHPVSRQRGMFVTVVEPSTQQPVSRLEWFRQVVDPVRIIRRNPGLGWFVSIIEPSLANIPDLATWQQPQSVPIRPQPRYASLTNWRGENREPTVHNPPPDVSWYQPTGEPRRTLPPRVPGLGFFAFVGNPADTTTNDNLRIEWFVQASEPVRGTKYAPPWAGQSVRPWEPSLLNDPPHLAWYRPPSEPVRVVPQTVRAEWWFGTFFAATTPVPFVSGWWVQPSEPVRTNPPRVPGIGTNYVGPIDPFTFDFYFDYVRQPAIIFRNPYLHPAGGLTEPLEPSLRVTPEVSSWWVQPNEPVRTMPPRIRDLGTVHVWPLEDTLYNEPPISWWSQPSEPVRKISPRVPGIGTSYVGPLEEGLYRPLDTIGWWTQTSEPVRTLPPRTPGIGHTTYFVFGPRPGDWPPGTSLATPGGVWYVGPQSLVWKSDGRGTTWYTQPGSG